MLNVKKWEKKKKRKTPPSILILARLCFGGINRNHHSSYVLGTTNQQSCRSTRPCKMGVNGTWKEKDSTRPPPLFTKHKKCLVHQSKLRNTNKYNYSRAQAISYSHRCVQQCVDYIFLTDWQHVVQQQSKTLYKRCRKHSLHLSTRGSRLSSHPTEQRTALGYRWALGLRCTK